MNILDQIEAAAKQQIKPFEWNGIKLFYRKPPDEEILTILSDVEAAIPVVRANIDPDLKKQNAGNEHKLYSNDGEIFKRFGIDPAKSRFDEKLSVEVAKNISRLIYAHSLVDENGAKIFDNAKGLKRVLSALANNSELVNYIAKASTEDNEDKGED